jgi:putative ABC transport system ATP-binding protein
VGKIKNSCIDLKAIFWGSEKISHKMPRVFIYFCNNSVLFPSLIFHLKTIILALIQTIGLAKTYKKGKVDIPALHDVTFEINEGEFFSIVGKSGSGKSTLLNLVGGLDTASAGTIIFDSKDLRKMSRSELANHRRFSVGMIFQSFNLVKSRNALENVELALIFGGVPRNLRRKKATDLLTQVGLGSRLTHTPDELSGGENQRVAIARALANNPKVLLADEPTGNLDSETSKEIIEILRDLNKNHHLTVIMVTHDLETAEIISDHIIRMKDGKIVDQLTKTEVL